MVKVFQASLRVCKGLVAFVLQGQTKAYRWSAAPALLMADLHRAGVHLRNPPVYHRVGIPGSGGPDWLRGDYEWVVCATQGGKLPWSENTACGHQPKWGPGGEMSHRLTDGQRVNQWGNVSGKRGGGNVSPDGKEEPAARPSHRTFTIGSGKRANGDGKGRAEDREGYKPPTLANPGNVLHFKVGGGLMGHPLAHENEAPFPLGLAEVFVRSFCPPDGITVDPFAGSGTTGHAAVLWRRRFIGCDVRESMVRLSERRLEGVTPNMFTEL